MQGKQSKCSNLIGWLWEMFLANTSETEWESIHKISACHSESAENLFCGDYFYQTRDVGQQYSPNVQATGVQNPCVWGKSTHIFSILYPHSTAIWSQITSKVESLRWNHTPNIERTYRKYQNKGCRHGWQWYIQGTMGDNACQPAISDISSIIPKATQESKKVSKQFIKTLRN